MPKPTKKTAARRAPTKKSGKADTRSKSKQRGDDEEEEEEEETPVIKRRGRAEDDDDDDVADDDQDELDDEEDDIAKSDDDEDDDESDDDAADDEDDEEEPTKKSKKGKKTPAKKSKVPAKKAKANVDDDDEGDLDDEDDDVDVIDEAVLKSLPERVRKQVEANQRIAKEALDIAKAERSRRVTLEFVEKAKKDIPNLPGTHEEKGGFLKALFSGEPVSKEIAKSIVKLLKTGDSAVRNLLMTEKGAAHRRVSNDGDSAYEQLCEKRDEILEKHKDLTRAQAMDKARQDNPDLYRQYTVEKARGRRREADDMD